MAGEVVGVQVNLLLSSLCTLEIACEPVLEVFVKGESEERRVRHSCARHLVGEVDIDHVEGKHQHINLLLGSQGEVLVANQHLQDVEASPHPSGVMSGTQTLGHLEVRQKASEELVGKYLDVCCTEPMIHASRSTSCNYHCTNSVTLGKLVYDIYV